MQHLQIFNYNNNNVTFKNEDGVIYVNATEMAKPFNKQAKDYLKTAPTQEFIYALAESQKDLNPIEKYYYTIQGGNASGTWMHEDVALDFAQWLSPVFRVWCNQMIKQLITTGKAEIAEPSEDEIILKSQNILTARVERLQEQNKLLSETIKEQAPIVEYANNVLSCDDAINITVIAKELGMSPNAMNKFLVEHKVLYKSSGVYVLYSKYQSEGYTKTVTHHFIDKEGKDRVQIHTRWTQKGKLFIHSLIKQSKAA